MSESNNLTENLIPPSEKRENTEETPIPTRAHQTENTLKENRIDTKENRIDTVETPITAPQRPKKLKKKQRKKFNEES
jgi:hypothetical protein